MSHDRDKTVQDQLGRLVLDYSKLTDEEKYILDGKRESNKRINEVIATLVKGRPKVLESISARIRSKQIVVRFLKPIEAFVGIDMNKYGHTSRKMWQPFHSKMLAR